MLKECEDGLQVVDTMMVCTLQSNGETIYKLDTSRLPRTATDLPLLINNWGVVKKLYILNDIDEFKVIINIGSEMNFHFIRYL